MRISCATVFLRFCVYSLLRSMVFIATSSPVSTERTSDTRPNAPLPSVLSCRYMSGLPTYTGCALAPPSGAAAGRLEHGAEGGRLCGCADGGLLCGCADCGRLCGRATPCAAWRGSRISLRSSACRWSISFSTSPSRGLTLWWPRAYESVGALLGAFAFVTGR